MIKKRIVLFMLLFSMLFCVTGCDNEDMARLIEDNTETDEIRIGMSFDSFIIERWQRDRDVFVSVAKELGATVNVQNANGDVEEQKKQIDYFIERGMDVIVIVSVDSGALKEQVAHAREAGIRVIAYDRLLTESDVDAYISFDNAMVGKMMAQSLIDQGLSGGKVLMLGGSPLDSNVPIVENAFRELAEENDMSVIGSMHADGWLAELAAEYIYDNMELVYEADAIMCGNDNIASCVMRALAEKRLAGSIFVVGQDAELEACQRIVEDTQLMTVYKPVEKLARRAAECAVRLAKGEALEGEDISSINDGEYDVTFVKLEPVSVTKKNMNDVIINSGFHLKEDVYLNVLGNPPNDYAP